MSEKERLNPSLIDVSRAQRIAKGSGRSLKDVNNLIKQFKQIRVGLAKMSKNAGMLSKLPGLNKLGGKMPSMDEIAKMMKSKKPSGLSMAAQRPVDREKLKRLRRATKQNKKRSRKR